MIKKALYIFISIVALGTLLLISFWINLSDEKLSSWLEFQINSRLPTNYRIQIQTASTRTWGLLLEKMTLKDIIEKNELLSIRSAEISFNVPSLLFFQKLPYRINLYQGNISGELVFFPKLHTRFSARGLQPNRHLVIRKTNLILSNPVLMVEGQISLSNPPEGDIKLKIRDILLAGETKHTHLPFDLPSTDFKSIDANLSLRQKQVEVAANSRGDLSANLKGTILFNWQKINRSKLNLTLKAGLKKAYRTKLGFIDDILQNYSNKSGQLSIKIKGSPANPKVEKI